jgi:acetyl esterase
LPNDEWHGLKNRMTPVLDRTTQAFIDRLAAEHGQPIYLVTPEEARSTLLQRQSVYSNPEVKIENVNAELNGRVVPLKIFRPAGLAASSPVILYFHGGGWVVGDSVTHGRLVSSLALGVPATVVFVDYHRAPEHQYPVAIEDGYATTLYVSERAERFRVDSKRLAVVGESSGGNMAAVVCLLAKRRSGPPITGQVLLYPVTNADFETGSYQAFADGPWLTRRSMQWFWDQYLPDQEKRKEPTASPLLASPRQLEGLPPALIITAENDVLRDEGEAYGRKLIQAGVEVVMTRYNGTIHDFLLLNALAASAPSRAAATQAIAFLKEILG